ncbi:MAG: Holliday junction branch migration protein RuvA [Candidatus Pacebacteria bacterium]|jgi:Holliday junction DNA helicase RuvA|nr:Holliday junction branch migration protein RuvA [Candidatus Paceibacterota bacterium]MBP9058642.1 Holliday junction branch migration protein RuvA [Candidatus Paceibacterota bacterium]MBP9770380.1 Holliday junction branch migration protein RuvA [Candidatus Paceibacterota bacterium]
MIARIEGKIITVSDKSLIVDVHGVGFRLYVPIDTIARNSERAGESISLLTHLNVKEDALDLYGFETGDELRFFEMLISVSGVGPKSALSIVSIGAIDSLKKAIGSGDTGYLTKVSGIGKKTAERIVIELRDKLALLGHTAEYGELSGETDVVAVLEELGYSREDARGALKQISENTTGTSARVKEALKILGQKNFN